jgi:muconolactone delta-isomerase
VAEKYLVLWRLELSRLTTEAARGVMRMQDYGKRLETEGKVLSRYHMVGSHGGAWIYAAESHEELDRLLALAPVYNFASYQVFPLAEMTGEPTVLGSEP